MPKTKNNILPGDIGEYSYGVGYKVITISLKIPIEQLKIPIDQVNDQVKTAIEEVKKAGLKNADLDAEVSTYLDAEVIKTKDGHEYIDIRGRGYYNREYDGYGRIVAGRIVALELKAAARTITKEEYAYHINTLPLEDLGYLRQTNG